MKGDGAWIRTAKYGDILHGMDDPGRRLMFMYRWNDLEFAGMVIEGFPESEWGPGFIWRGMNFNWGPEDE